MKKKFLSLFLATSASLVTLCQFSLSGEQSRKSSLKNLIDNVEIKKKIFLTKEKEIEEAQKIINDKERERDNLRGEYEAAQKSYTEEFESKVQLLSTDAPDSFFGSEEYDSKIAPLSSKIQQLILAIDRLKFEKDTEDQQKSKANSAIEQATKDKEKVDLGIDLIKKKKGKLVKDLESKRLEDELTELRSSFETVEVLISKNDAEIKNLNKDKEDKEATVKEKEVLRSTEDTPTAQINKKKQFRPGQKNSEPSSKTDVLQLEIDALKGDISTIEARIDILNSQQKKNSDLKNALNQKIKDKEDEIKDQSKNFNKRAKLVNDEHRNEAVKSLDDEGKKEEDILKYVMDITNQKILEEDYDSLAAAEKELYKIRRIKKKVIGENKVNLEQSTANAKKIDVVIKKTQEERDSLQMQLEQEVRKIGKEILSRLQDKMEAGQSLTSQEKIMVDQVQQLTPTQPEKAEKDPSGVADHPSVIEEHAPKGKKVYVENSDGSTSPASRSNIKGGKPNKILDDSDLTGSTKQKQLQDEHSTVAGDLAIASKKRLMPQSETLDTEKTTLESSSAQRSGILDSQSSEGTLTGDSLSDFSQKNNFPRKRTSAVAGLSENDEESVKQSRNSNPYCEGVECPEEVQAPKYSKEDAQKALEILKMAKGNGASNIDKQDLLSQITKALDGSGISNETLKKDILNAIKKKLGTEMKRDNNNAFNTLRTELENIAK